MRELSGKTKTVIGAVAVLVVGSLIGGGIAWAAVAPPPVPLTPDDTMYACVSEAGKVKAGTWRLNVVPTSCPKATDVVKSWNQQGSTSAVQQVVTVPLTTRLELESTGSVSGPGTPLTWADVAEQSTTVDVAADARLKVSWSASTACFGVNRKYARLMVDGTFIGGGPLTDIGHTDDFPPVATEATVVIEGVTEVGPGSHTVTLQTAFDPGASCVISPPDGGAGLLTVEVLTTG